MRKKGFTLIELLTVVAILAILAAILMPVFIQVKNYAHQYMAGQSMMKLSTVTTMYITDHDDQFPLGYYPLENGRRQNWFGVLDRKGNVERDSSLLSPYIKGKIQPDSSLNAKPWMGDATGYGYNWGYLGSDFYVPGAYSTNYACVNPASTSFLTDPSQTIEYGTSIFFFASWLPGGDDANYRYGFIDPPKVWFGNPTLDFRHMGDRTVNKRKREVNSTGSALVVFADGHLKTMSQKSVKNKHFARDDYEYFEGENEEDDRSR